MDEFIELEDIGGVLLLVVVVVVVVVGSHSTVALDVLLVDFGNSRGAGA